MKWSPWPCLLSLAAACGSEPAPLPPLEVAIREGAPAEMSFAVTGELTAPAAVEALGLDAAGALLVAAGGAVYQQSSGVLSPRRLYAGPGEPDRLGAVLAITAGAGSAYLAAERGMFVVDSLYVLSMPVAPIMGVTRSLAYAPAGVLRGLWLAGERGLFRLAESGALERYEVPGLAPPYEQVAVAPEGTGLLVMAGGELALLEVAGAQILSDRPPLGAGRIHGVAAANGALYAASERGLLRFEPRAEPRWSLYTLAAPGQPGQEVRQVATDPVSGVAWAATASGLVELDGASLARYPGAGDALRVDGHGDVWTATGTRLSYGGRGAAAPVSFATDVRPWIERHCSRCHMNATQNFEDRVVFAERAEAALSRVRSGDMPRCDGGLLCSSSMRLTPAEYAVLEAWIRAGKPE